MLCIIVVVNTEESRSYGLFLFIQGHLMPRRKNQARRRNGAKRKNPKKRKKRRNKKKELSKIFGSSFSRVEATI